MTGIDVLIIDYKKKQLERLNKSMKQAGLQPALWVPEEWLDRVKSFFDGGVEFLAKDDERKFSRIWAHTSTTMWDAIVRDKAAGQCFLTLYTSGDGIERKDKDKVELSIKFNEVTNILSLLDNETSFVEALVRYREQPGQPFSVKTDKEIAMALAILCQGYLTAFAANQSHVEHVSTDWLTKALSQMGWTNLPEDHASALREFLKGKFDEVQKPLWWLEPFGLTPDKDGIEDPSWLPFKKQIEQEWRLNSFDEASSILQSILGRIKNNQAPGSPSEVAQLYCELAELLGGRQCTT